MSSTSRLPEVPACSPATIPEASPWCSTSIADDEQRPAGEEHCHRSCRAGHRESGRRSGPWPTRRPTGRCRALLRRRRRRGRGQPAPRKAVTGRGCTASLRASRRDDDCHGGVGRGQGRVSDPTRPTSPHLRRACRPRGGGEQQGRQQQGEPERRKPEDTTGDGRAGSGARRARSRDPPRQPRSRWRHCRRRLPRRPAPGPSRRAVRGWLRAAQRAPRRGRPTVASATCGDRRDCPPGLHRPLGAGAAVAAAVGS